MMKNKKVITFLYAMVLILALSACSDSTTQKDTVWIGPSDFVDSNGMSLYWQDENIYFAADDSAKISLYVNAEKDSDGNFIFDDGQDWLLTMETSFGDYPLFPREYVQIGAVSYRAFIEYGGGGYDIFHVLVTVRQSAGCEIYDCIFDNDKKAFQVTPIYNATNINPVGGSREA